MKGERFALLTLILFGVLLLSFGAIAQTNDEVQNTCTETQCSVNSVCYDKGASHPDDDCQICTAGLWADDPNCQIVPPPEVQCDDSQTIMKLSKATNAHGGLWDKGNHSVRLCYPSIFNENYLGVNPHECKNDSTNRVLILSDEKNAHGGISINALQEGDVEVCYGDLSCRSVNTDSGGSCDDNEKEVLSLYQTEDSHISLSDDAYPIKICCSISGGNASLSVEIVKPDPWSKFIVEDEVEFEVIIPSASQLGADVDITWDFGDGNITTRTGCLSAGNCNIVHKYEAQAHYTVVASVKKQGSTESAMDHVNILVYDNGLNLFAIITEPGFGEEIVTDTSVRFNASGSFVAQCEGSCPSGESCYSITGDSQSLECYDLEKPPKPGESGVPEYLFWFNWTFDAGKGTADEKNLLGNWNSNYSNVVEFDRTFFAEGNHTASLRVGYEEL